MKRKRLTKEERGIIYELFEGRCAYCGKEIGISEMQVDHIIPLRNGGADDISNMYPACRPCNKYKSTYTVEKFREQLGKLPGRFRRDVSTFKLAETFGLVTVNQKEIEFYFEEEEHE